MGSGLSFLGAFSQGFGESFFKKKQQQHQDELEQKKQQWSVLSDAFQRQASLGNNQGAASILRIMSPLMGDGKGKDGKGQPTLIDNLADEIERGRDVTTTQPSEAANQAQLDINQTQQDNPDQLKDMGRPRTAMETTTVHKGFYPTPGELEADKQAILLPGQLKEFGTKQDISYNIWQGKEDRKKQIWEVKEKIRQDNREHLKTILKPSTKQSELITSYQSMVNPDTGRTYTLEEAKTESGKDLLNMFHATYNDTLSRTDDRTKRFTESQRMHDQQIAQSKAVVHHLGIIEEQGYKRLANDATRLGISQEELKQKYGAVGQARKDLDQYNKEIDDARARIGQAHAALNRMTLFGDKNDPDFQHAFMLAHNELSAANSAYLVAEDRRNKAREKAENLSKEFPQFKDNTNTSNTSNNSGKSMGSRKQKSNDPLGIR
jgi:hypothetical protein